MAFIPLLIMDIILAPFFAVYMAITDPASFTQTMAELFQNLQNLF